MQGPLTQECVKYLLQEVFKSKLSTPLEFIGEESLVQRAKLPTSHMICPLTMSLPCDMSHVGEVEGIEESSRPDVEATWSSS
jgi:hypothetical protein